MRKLILLFLLPMLLMAAQDTLNLIWIDSANTARAYRRYTDTTTWTKSAGDTLYIMYGNSYFDISAFDKAIIEGWGALDTVVLWYQTAMDLDYLDSVTVWDSLTYTADDPTQPAIQTSITLPVGNYLGLYLTTASDDDHLIKIILGLFDDDK